MAEVKNILYIMYDQLRFDYLSCAGHPHLKTPNFDRVAAMGVRFTRAYVQSPICGSSRMSAYTGRYCHSHGAQWNGYPLRVGEPTMGDHLRAIGMGCHLIGKTHMRADKAGMTRLGLEPTSLIGVRTAECGFDPYVRDDGLWAQGPEGYYDEKRSPYNAYLRAKGYKAGNPWHDYANSGLTNDDEMASGFLIKYADRPANIAEEDSETPWLTSRAIDFIEEQSGEEPWLAHLSYIKPHWPYVVPAPYHAMYGPNHVPAPVRNDQEWENPHPVMGRMMQSPIGRAFHKKEVRDLVIPAYMGLIKQCDDQLGRLLDYLEKSGRMQNTMIVLTSDHGDYLGDHWLGEKNLFHDCSVKVPLIVYDPSAAADGTRGTTDARLVELIDLVATFIEAAGGTVPDHIVEGRSLMPLIHGQDAPWREFAISEYDYGPTPVAGALGVAPKDARLMMVATDRWKFVHDEGSDRRQLFDMETDPDELNDLSHDPDHTGVLAQMYDHLNTWARRMSQRITLSEDQVRAMAGKSARRGVLLGMYDGSEYPEDLQYAYQPRSIEDRRDP
ncbi:MAG: sulfatase-like hydrolase/transferase [Pseudomonadota bacterium]